MLIKKTWLTTWARCIPSATSVALMFLAGLRPSQAAQMLEWYWPQFLHAFNRRILQPGTLWRCKVQPDFVASSEEHAVKLLAEIGLCCRITRLCLDAGLGSLFDLTGQRSDWGVSGAFSDLVRFQIYFFILLIIRMLKVETVIIL